MLARAGAASVARGRVAAPVRAYSGGVGGYRQHGANIAESRLPRRAVALGRGMTGLEKEVLCIVPAWDADDERQRLLVRQNFATVKTAAREAVREWFEWEHAGELGPVEHLAKYVLIAAWLDLDGARWVPDYLKLSDAEFKEFHDTRYVSESPVPDGWTPNTDGFAPEEAAELETDVASYKERIDAEIKARSDAAYLASLKH